MFNNLNVLYAEDEDLTRKNIVEVLEFMSVNVTAVSNGEEAYTEYLKNKPDVIITDIKISLLDGLELVEKIRKKDKHAQIIIATSCIDIECFLKVVEFNLVKYLLKPVSLNDLKDALTICMENIEEKRKKLNYYFNQDSFYNLSKQHLYVDKKTVRLDYHEREFLELLLKSYHRIVTYNEIEKEVWDNNMSSAAVRSLVRNLRKKLPSNVIDNISKIGYKINIQNY